MIKIAVMNSRIRKEAIKSKVKLLNLPNNPYLKFYVVELPLHQDAGEDYHSTNSELQRQV